MPTNSWQVLGEVDPYYAVFSKQQFHTERMDEKARLQFFERGEQHVAELVDTIERWFTPAPFRPRRAIDFGCGVGRLIIPLSRVTEEVVGIDVAPAMLQEARRNCERAGVTNVRVSTAFPDPASGRFEYIQSLHVFQHIPPARGYEILAVLLDLVADDGIGALHFVVDRRAPLYKTAAAWLRVKSSLFNGLVNLARGDQFRLPPIAMYVYSLPRIIRMLNAAGFEHVLVKTIPGEHPESDLLRVVLFFRKSAVSALAKPESD